MKIALIGTGNVAWHMAKAVVAAGHEFVAYVSRTLTSGEEFTHEFPQARRIALSELGSIQIDVLILAVPDHILPVVAPELEVNSTTIVVHTSGSQPLSIIDTLRGAKTGVFYPVQTFTKHKPVDFSQIPVLIEGIDKDAELILLQFAKTLSNNVQVKDSTARKQLHLAAVFACNFTNHLLGISQHLLHSAGLTTDLLQPLIQETITKATTNDPFKVQTGPAARNDVNVVQEHITILEKHPVWQELYKKLSLSIQDQKQNSVSSRK